MKTKFLLSFSTVGRIRHFAYAKSYKKGMIKAVIDFFFVYLQQETIQIMSNNQQNVKLNRLKAALAEQGKTLTTYLIDGDPKGTRYVFISNKICQMYVIIGV